jgi:predicted protein tyrosine phosphatase
MKTKIRKSEDEWRKTLTPERARDAWKKIEVLGIPDNFYYNQLELKRLLKDRVKQYLLL